MQLKKCTFKFEKNTLHEKKLGPLTSLKNDNTKVKIESRFISKNGNSITQMLGPNQFYVTSKNVCHSRNHALLASFMKTRDLFYQKVPMELLIHALFFKLNLEIITSICRMNYSFYYSLSILASLISRAGQPFLVVTRRIHQCYREFAIS